MPVMRHRTAAGVAANTVVKGVFQGELHEYVQSPRAMVNIYAVADVNDLHLTLNIGGRLVVADQVIPFDASAPTVIKPDHLVYRGGALRGDRIQVDYRTVTALSAAGDLDIVVDIIPV